MIQPLKQYIVTSKVYTNEENICRESDVICNAVCLSRSSPQCSPFSTNSRANASFPVLAAQCSAVQPSLSFSLTSAPFSTSSRATASFPISAAICSAVQHSDVFASTSAPFSTSSRATASSPAQVAQCSAVQPSL